MGYESGQKCYVSGVYKCTNCGNTIPLSKGETFTPCSCGDANWVLDRKVRNFMTSISAPKLTTP